jgi:hypothetical protein
MSITLAALIVSVFLEWDDTNSMEQGTKIYREIAGAFQQVGEVGPDVTVFDETLSASEGAQLCYHVKPFDADETAPASNEWCGTVAVTQPPPPPCTPPQSRKCRGAKK